MIKNFLRDERGVSYPELLVVIFIIVILSSTTLSNATGSGRAGEVYIAAQKIMTNIRQAQNYALSAKEFGDPPETPNGGWGIYLNKDRDYHSMYADEGEMGGTADGDHVCLDDCSPISAERYRDMKIPNNIKIDKIELTRTGDNVVFPVDKVNVTFEPPDPVTHICLDRDDCAYDQVEIFLINQYLDKRKIVINFFGLIDTREAAY